VSFCLSFRRKSLASQADDQADETETEVKIEEIEKREAIWVKNCCKFQANEKRRDELANDEVKNLDEDWVKETINFQADNEMNFQETVEADEVELNHSD